MIKKGNLEKEFENKLKWFIDRIGSRIYRDKIGTCTCMTCERILKEGLIIEDKEHARYLLDCSMEGMYEYRDKKEKRVNYCHTCGQENKQDGKECARCEIVNTK